MKNLVNTIGIKTNQVLSIASKGEFRFVVKCRGGFMTVIDARANDNEQYMKYPETLLSSYIKGALQTIEFKPEGYDNYLTVFARNGKKIILIDEAILTDLTVSTINQFWVNTELYNQSQYSAVGAKTWADKAYVDNRIAEVA